METTKQLSKIYVPKNLTKEVVIKDSVSISKEIMKRILNTLKDDFKNLNDPWVQTKGYGYYLPSESIFIPSVRVWSKDAESIKEKKILDKYDADILPLEIGQILFCRTDSPFFKNNPYDRFTTQVQQNSQKIKK